MLHAFPKMLIAVLLYNLLVFGGGAMHHQAADLLAQNFPVTVVSGDVWKISVSDALIALSLVLLFIEIIKATRTSRREILNHALSTLTLMGAVAEFAVLKGFGTSTFFLITLMVLLDVLAGFIVTIVASRRDIDLHG